MYSPFFWYENCAPGWAVNHRQRCIGFLNAVEATANMSIAAIVYLTARRLIWRIEVG